MALMQVPDLKTRYPNQKGFTLNLKERACRAGVNFYDMFCVRLADNHRLVYACRNCCEDVVGVVSETHGKETASRDDPCIVDRSAPCHCVKTKQAMGSPEILRNLPAVGDKFSNVSKIFARVEIYCVQNGKPMWNANEGGPLASFVCPCEKGVLYVNRYWALYIIKNSHACACKLADGSGAGTAASVANVAPSVSFGKRRKVTDLFHANTDLSGNDAPFVYDEGEEFTDPEESDAEDQDYDRKPPARDNATGVRVHGRNESAGEGVFRISDGDRGNFGSGDAAATGGAMMFASMQNSDDGQSLAINVVIRQDSRENPNTAFELNLNRGRSTSEDPGSESRGVDTGFGGSDSEEEVIILEPPCETCMLCEENLSPPWATIICSCEPIHRPTYCQGCLEHLVKKRPPGLPAYATSAHGDEPINAFLRMEPEQRHRHYKCEGRFDSYVTHLGQTKIIRYPVGYAPDGPRWDLATFEQQRLAHVAIHGPANGWPMEALEQAFEPFAEANAEAPEANVETDLASRGVIGRRRGPAPENRIERGAGR